MLSSTGPRPSRSGRPHDRPPATAPHGCGDRFRLDRAARLLLRPADFSGRLRRPAFAQALALAVGVLAVARLMDLLVFGAVPGATPAFFVACAGVPVASALPAMGIRRLRDAGAARWLLLLALVPLLGWAVLAWLLGRPSQDFCRAGDHP